MDYFSSIWFKIGLVFLVLVFILDIAKHLLKKKLIEFVLHSEERRQVYIRMDSSLISYERKLFWSMLAISVMLALTTYYFLPYLLYLPIVTILFCPIVLEDYFYRKSFLEAINKEQKEKFYDQT